MEIRILFVLLLILLPDFLQADEFTVNPQACATTLEQMPCRFQVDIHFHSDIQQDLCLWLKHESKPLYCYQALTELNMQLTLALQRDTTIELRDMSTKLLASLPLSLALYHPAPKRKRRGLNWDLL